MGTILLAIGSFGLVAVAFVALYRRLTEARVAKNIDEELEASVNPEQETLDVETVEDDEKTDPCICLGEMVSWELDETDDDLRSESHSGESVPVTPKVDAHALLAAAVNPPLVVRDIYYKP